MALVTAADLYPLIPGLSGGADASLTALLAAVEGSVAHRLGIPATTPGGSPVLDDVAHTFYLSGPTARDSRRIRIPVQPVQSVTTIHDDPDWSYAADSLVAAADYTLDGAAGLVWVNPTASHAWSRRTRAIRVVAVCGWTAAPEPLKRGILLWAAVAWSQNAGSISRDAQTSGPGRVRWRLPEIPPEAARLIDAHRMSGEHL